MTKIVRPDYAGDSGYIIEREGIDRISAVDLTKEASEAVARSEPVEYYRVVEIGEDGYRKSVSGGLLWFPDLARAGIEFGADAQWTDATSPDDALQRWVDAKMIG